MSSAVSGVYSAALLGSDEILYVGSSVSVHRRWSEHRNPNFANHGDFGKYIHKHGIVDKIIFTVLENFDNWNGTRVEMMAELRRKEFLWKHALPKQIFGKNDGLCYQPIEVQRKIKSQNDSASRVRRIAADPLFHAKEAKHRQLLRNAKLASYQKRELNYRLRNRESINAWQRKHNAEIAKKEGRTITHRVIRGTRPFCPIRAARNKQRKNANHIRRIAAGEKFTHRLTHEARLYELYLELQPKIGPVVGALDFL